MPSQRAVPEGAVRGVLLQGGRAGEPRGVRNGGGGGHGLR